jgi:hypothetical protein
LRPVRFSEQGSKKTTNFSLSFESHNMEQLFNELAPYGWSRETLEIWSRSDFKCVYCNLDMLASVDNNQLGALDHLLPQSRYPLLVKTPSNLVLSCWVCNRIKRHWDANTRVGNPVYHDESSLDDNQRTELIERSRQYVKSQRDNKTAALQEQSSAIEKFRRRQRGMDSGE